MDRLYLARQEVLRSYDADPASHERSAQVERHQRWRNCSAMSELCTDLLCQVSDVQNQTLDKVFARQVMYPNFYVWLLVLVQVLCQRALLCCS